MKLSFVIPCYRSEKTIGAVVDELHSTLMLRPDVAYEIVLVSDNSPDNVYAEIERISVQDSVHVKGIELARNFGQHAALMAGYRLATGDIIISLDDDGQAPVESVFDLVDALERESLDVVYGAYEEKKHNVFRNIGSRINDWMACWLLDKPRNLKVTSYFAARRFVIEEIIRYGHAFPYVIGLVLRTTSAVGNLYVKHRDRLDGASGYTFYKLLGLWFNGFTAFSVKPLRLATWAGFVCAFLGFIYGVWTVINKLVIHPDAPMGYSSLMSTLLFLGGMLMLVLGLIGEYLGRIYICINRSPQYVISRQTFKIPAKRN